MTAWAQQQCNNSRGQHHGQGSSASKYADPDLRTRTSWVDAAVAAQLIQNGEATGNSCALLIRSHLQKHLYNLGCFQQRHSKKVLLLGIIILSLFAVGLKTVTIESDVEKLWIQEGGRLQKELEYTETILGDGFGSTSQIIVQTPHDSSTSKNLLTPQSLLLHLDAVRRATQVEVHLFDKVWRFSDVCYKASFPSFENTLMEPMLEKMLPCIIITPLDCFWEGSKLLGPRYPIIVGHGIEDFTWENLNPMELMNQLENTWDLNFDSVKDVLRRAGITTGYQEKPCLDPTDPGCPELSPNYRSTEILNAAPYLTGGCAGFAPALMHWEEDMIVGGIKKNRSNTVVNGKGLQTVVQIMGEQELFEYYNGDFIVDSMDWTREKAQQILQVFQKKFAEAVVEIATNTSTSDQLSSFTQASLVDIMNEYSSVSYIRISIGYVLMLIYAVLTLMNCTNAVSSQAGVGIFGVLLVSLSVAAGLGLCSLFRLPFNAATTQIMPFLALGLGVDDMFLMAYAFAENNAKPFIEYHQHAGELLKRAGTTVLLTSLSNSCAFFLAAIVPIPALRVFCLQGGILLLFNLLSMLLVFPALLSIDSWRRKEAKIDFFCCFDATTSSKVKDISQLEEFRQQETPPPYHMHESVAVAQSGQPSTMLAPPDYNELEGLPASTSNSTQNLTSLDRTVLCSRKNSRDCCSFSLTWLVGRFYVPLLEKTWVKVITCVLFTALLCLSGYGITQVEDGMDLKEIVPRDTNEFIFLEAQAEYFGFHNMYIITKDEFSYHTSDGQQQLKDLHHKISLVDHVVRKDDGTATDLWLDLMIQWLRDLQLSFDQDFAAGRFHSTGWHRNASDAGVLAYKLLIQTGEIDHPVDYNRVGRVRLVGDDGTINSDGFYNYLTAWIYNDLLAYDISQAVIRPLPKEWYYVPYEDDLLIPKAPSIIFARMPFYLKDLSANKEIIDIITKIRDICDEATEAGLPNYPSGVLFTFWEQYLHLRFYLTICLATVIAAVFLVVTVILLNPWAAILVAVTLTMISIELFGFMGLVGIKLSAVPVVILIVSVGIGVEFTIHVLMGFITSIGDRAIRIERSLKHMFAPVTHGAISTLLGILLLVASEFDFIVKYFFLCFVALVFLGLLNGLLLFPILLSIFGPNGEIRPVNKDATSIDIPTPEPSPPPTPEAKKHKPRRHRKPQHRVPSEATLSTISEEDSHVSSHEIIVEPQVHVETTVSPPNNEKNTCGTSCNSEHLGRKSKTTVKAKATVTVEVHTSLPGSTCDEQNYKRKRRKQNADQECHCSEVEDYDITSV